MTCHVVRLEERKPRHDLQGNKEAMYVSRA